MRIILGVIVEIFIEKSQISHSFGRTHSNLSNLSKLKYRWILPRIFFFENIWKILGYIIKKISHLNTSPRVGMYDRTTGYAKVVWFPLSIFCCCCCWFAIIELDSIRFHWIYSILNQSSTMPSFNSRINGRTCILLCWTNRN